MEAITNTESTNRRLLEADIEKYIMDVFAINSPDGFYLSPLNDGLSGARVYLLKVLTPRRTRDAGTYVLKLVNRNSKWFEEEDNEAVRSEQIYEQVNHFRDHLVKMKYRDNVGEWLVMLLTFALKSERETISAARLRLDDRLELLQQISYDMLKKLNYGVVSTSVQGGMLKSLCKHRLESDGRFYSRLDSLLRIPDRPALILNGSVFPNPGYYIEKLDDILAIQHISYIRGKVHGDFHLNNIITKGLDYAVIDYDSCEDNYLLYDQAYLELDNYSYISRDRDLDWWSVGMEYLFCIEDAEKDSAEYYSMTAVEKRIRGGIWQWAGEEAPNNIDSLKIQLQLARIAAGITFFSRSTLENSLAEQKKYLIYVCSGMTRLFSMIGFEWEKQDYTELKSAGPNIEEVGKLWNECAGFSPSYIKILITDDCYGEMDYQKAGRAGYVDWRLVVDAGAKEPPQDIMSSLNLKNNRVNVLSEADNFLPGHNTGVFLCKRGEKQRAFEHWKVFRRRFLPILKMICSREPGKSLAVFMDFHSADCEIGNRLMEALFEEDYIPNDSRFICMGTYRQNAVSKEEMEEKRIRYYMHPDADLTTLSEVIAAYEISGKSDGKEVFLPCIDTVSGIVTKEELDSFASCVELIYPGMENTLEDYSDGEHFFKGNEVSWSDLEWHNDVIWGNYDIWKEWLKEKLERGNGGIFKLSHAPAAGGTTLSRRLMWDMKDSWPTFRIRQYTPDTANVMIEIYRKTGKCMLAVVEMGSSVVSEDELLLLKRKVEGSSCRAVFLAVERSEKQPEEGNGIYLAADLDSEDARRFCTEYSQKTEDTRRLEHLQRLTYDRDSEEMRSQRCPFFYGFYTFQEEYEGIGKFLNSTLSKCSDTEKNLLSDLAVMTMYSQNVCMPPQEIAHRYQIENWSYAGVDEAVGSRMGRIVVHREEGYRICHPVIAERLLEKITGDHRKATFLHQATIIFIENIHDNYTELSRDYVDRVLKELFIDRSYIDGEQQKFSTLITDLQYLSWQTEVFKTLITYYPDNPHYYNHLGRLQIKNQSNLQFDKAVASLKKALEVCRENTLDETPHHTTLGCIYSRKVADDLSGRELTPGQMLDAISVDFALAEEEFGWARKLRGDSSYGYFPHILMVCRVVEKITRASGKALKSLLKDGAFARWYYKHAGEVLQLFEEMKRNCSDERSEELTRRAELKIAILQDDIKSIKRRINQIEIANLSAEEKKCTRRTFAMMLHMQNNYHWEKMQKDDLALAETEMEKVLLAGTCSQSDVRTWFNAYRQMETFDTGKAKQYLFDYMEESYEKSYLLWILSFKDYMDGKISYEQVRIFMDACRNSSKMRDDSVRTTRVIDAYTIEEKGFPIQKWDSKLDENGNNPILKVFTGKIVNIDRTVKGTIQLDSRDEVLITFVPSYTVGNERREFTRSDINSRVKFYMVFTYSGYRAWNPVKI